MNLSDPVVLIVVALAAYRLWKLVAEDLISQRLRDRLSDRAVEFVACPWCLGFWISLIVVVVAANWEIPITLSVFAVSAIVGMLGEWF